MIGWRLRRKRIKRRIKRLRGGGLTGNKSGEKRGRLEEF